MYAYKIVLVGTSTGARTLLNNAVVCARWLAAQHTPHLCEMHNLERSIIEYALPKHVL